jgi:hypothetical protein
MHLREAREKGKLSQFVKEHEKKYPRASRVHFYGVIRSMAFGKSKAKRGTSRKASRTS